MEKIPESVARLQETCERARRKISENTAEYKKSLRDFVPLPVERFTYELDTFSQISHYLNIPERDMFSYEDWADYLSDIIHESEIVHMRSFADRSRLESLVSTVKELRRVGESHPHFLGISRRREEVINEFLDSPYLIMYVSTVLPEEIDILKAWSSRDDTKEVVLLEPMIHECIQEVRADEKIFNQVKKRLLSFNIKDTWCKLIKESQFPELYKFVLSVTKKVARISE